MEPFFWRVILRPVLDSKWILSGESQPTVCIHPRQLYSCSASFSSERLLWTLAINLPELTFEYVAFGVSREGLALIQMWSARAMRQCFLGRSNFLWTRKASVEPHFVPNSPWSKTLYVIQSNRCWKIWPVKDRQRRRQLLLFSYFCRCLFSCSLVSYKSLLANDHESC